MPRASPGTRNATENASISGPLPNTAAIATSRTSPSTRLATVDRLTVRNPAERLPAGSGFLSDDGLEPGAVDIKLSKDIDHPVRRQAPVDGPIDDLEVLVPRVHAVEHSIDQAVAAGDQRIDLAERLVVEFGPAFSSAEMFDPSVAAIGSPVFAVPVANGLVAQVASVFLAFDPLMALRLALRFVVNAGTTSRQYRLRAHHPPPAVAVVCGDRQFKYVKRFGPGTLLPDGFPSNGVECRSGL